jgi:hypothetical protein
MFIRPFGGIASAGAALVSPLIFADSFENTGGTAMQSHTPDYDPNGYGGWTQYDPTYEWKIHSGGKGVQNSSATNLGGIRLDGLPARTAGKMRQIHVLFTVESPGQIASGDFPFRINTCLANSDDDRWEFDAHYNYATRSSYFSSTVRTDDDVGVQTAYSWGQVHLFHWTITEADNYVTSAYAQQRVAATFKDTPSIQTKYYASGVPLAANGGLVLREANDTEAGDWQPQSIAIYEFPDATE